jgi:hypothetical protein
MVELYLWSPIILHGVLRNLLSTKTPLPFTLPPEYEFGEVTNRSRHSEIRYKTVIVILFCRPEVHVSNLHPVQANLTKVQK